jgi:hypothetical protein
MRGEREGVVQDLLLDLQRDAIGMRIARSALLLNQGCDAADLEGADFVEGGTVLAHEFAGLGDVTELLGQLQQGQCSLGTLRERSHLGSSNRCGGPQSILETLVAAPTLGKIRDQLNRR